MKCVLVPLIFIAIWGLDCGQDTVYNYEETGIASYYANMLVGRPTANGDVFSQDSLTAAHKTLPFGTKVLITNLGKKKSVQVTINDRGPFVDGRIIDLSRRAADSIDLLKSGIAVVKIQAYIPE